jgi:hypothetical protein
MVYTVQRSVFWEVNCEEVRKLDMVECRIDFGLHDSTNADGCTTDCYRRGDLTGGNARLDIAVGVPRGSSKR